MPWLMLAWSVAHAADIEIPADRDPLGWARAWTEVTEALQDPALQDTRIRWARVDGRWRLTLELGDQRATLDGLSPASDHAGRVEQIYVALGLVGVADRRPHLAEHLRPPPRPAVVQPVLPPEPPEPVVEPTPPRLDPPLPVEAPPVRIQVERTTPPPPAAPAPLPRSWSVAGLVYGDSNNTVHFGMQALTALGSRVGVGGRLELGLGQAPRTAEPLQTPPSIAPVRETRGRFEALGELRLGHVHIGLGAGGQLRSFRAPGRSLGAGMVPSSAVRLGFVAAPVRFEMGVVHDWRPVVLSGAGRDVMLRNTRITLGVGLQWGRS